MSVDYEERSGRPSTGTTTENVAKMRDILLEDQRRRIHDVCNIILRRFEAQNLAQTSRQVAQQLLGRATIMTALRLTCRSLWGSFWLIRIRQSSPPSLLAGPRPLWFLKMKLKPKGRRFDAIKEIQTVSQRVMQTLKQMASRSAFDQGNPAGIAVSMPNGTTSKGMGAKWNFSK